MIKGLHVTFFTRHGDELRSFLKDKLELSFTDAGHGWLIFDVPKCEVAAHPTGEEEGGGGEGEPPAGMAEASFYCDDLEETMRGLKEKGVEFASEMKDEGWGLTVRVRAAPDVEVTLFEPRY